MTRPATQAAIRRAIRAAQGCDLTVTGYRVQPDGTIEVQTAPPAAPATEALGSLAAWRERRDAHKARRPA